MAGLVDLCTGNAFLSSTALETVRVIENAYSAPGDDYA